jgi:hypothetical protein
MVPAAQQGMTSWVESGMRRKFEVVGDTLGSKLLTAASIGFITVFYEAIQEISSANTRIARDT